MSVPLHAPARELARLVATRALSPVEIVERNARAHPRAEPGAERLRRRGRRPRPRRRPRGGTRAHASRTWHFSLGTWHLSGVPVSIKSSIAVQGLPWETGSRFREGVVGDADAPLVARLKAAGAIVIGVTNVAEQLMAWETDNALYGRTQQPVGARSHAGRIERRRSGGHRRGPLGRRRRQRRRRIDPRARALQRHLRAEADARPRAGHGTLPALRRSLRAHRRRRADGADGGRRGDAAGGDGWTRHRRSERPSGAVRRRCPRSRRARASASSKTMARCR